MSIQEIVGGKAQDGEPIASGTGRSRKVGAAMASVAATVALGTLMSAGPAAASLDDFTDIRSESNSLCLDVREASTRDGASVVQADCWGGYNQKWKLEYKDTPWFSTIKYYEVRVLHSEMCLDVRGPARPTTPKSSSGAATGATTSSSGWSA